MGSEILRYIRLEAFFEERVLKEVGAFVVSSLLIPANHEVMPVSTISNGSLVHDTEVVAIFEDLLASLLRVDADNLCCVCHRSFKIVLLDHTIAFKDFPYGFRCIEWQ